MFGDSVSGWIGADLFILDFESLDGFLSIFFMFQIMFCGAAATIIFGIVAERLMFGSYMFVALVVSGLLYPVDGHWVWAALDGWPRWAL
jgi:Amt family ammonium transporter